MWTDTHWLRPGWAWPVALASLLGAAGSLASVASPLAGLIAAAVAALCLALEGAGLDEPAAAADPPPRHAVRRLAAGGRTTASR